MLVYNWALVPPFGGEPVAVPDWVGTLLQLGVGGYIAGRTVEKSVEK